MKVAFVNQPIDRILPPIQTSIGACSYGLARALAPSCEVIVYGRAQSHEDAPASFTQDGVQFRFVASPRIDLLLERAFPKYRALAARVTGKPGPPFSTSPWWYPGYGWRVARDLRAEQCDVVHIEHSSQYIRPVRRQNRRSKVVLQLQAEWFPQCHLRLVGRRIRSVDQLLAASSHIARQTVRRFPRIASRCTVLHDGIDPADFGPVADRDCGDGTVVRLLYVGAVSPHKGVHVLVDAFNEVVERFPGVRLDIVGVQYSYGLEEVFPADDHEALDRMRPFYATPYTPFLRAQLSPAAAERVEFHGAVDRADLLRFYGSADVFVFPSVWNEGFGIPPVEAMAAGVPVVASRVGAIPETVLDGVTGLLVDPDNAKALADALLQLLEDPARRASLAGNARRRGTEYFGWATVAREATEIYAAL